MRDPYRPESPDEEILGAERSAVKTELTEPKLWFPVPGQYGGIAIELRGTELAVSNSSRAGGWSLAYRVTRSSVQFVEERIDAPGAPPIVRSADPDR